MSQGTEGMYGRAMPGAGWIGFAGIMLILVGFFNVIDGIAAISNSKYVVNQLLFSNLDAWGWFFLIWGVIQIIAGFAVLGGAAWAAVVGVVTAFFNAIAQLSWVHVNPVWAVCAIVIDVLVIYGLLVYGGRGSEV
jgi:hypothetical protein